MAKLIEQKTFALIMDQDELNMLYRIMINSAEIVDEIVVEMAEAIVDSVTNIDDEEEMGMPF